MKDLSKYSYAELQELQRDIDRELGARRSETVKELRKQFQALAKESGIPLEEIIPPRMVASSKRKTAMYRHPEDPGKTWAGRGRQPFWVKEYLAQGGDLRDLRVD